MNSNERNESRLSRRQLLKAAATAGVAGAFALNADPLGMPIGCQLWPVRKMLGEDFGWTLAQLAAIGYKRVEMCSPASYAEGFGPLAAKKADEVRHSIEAAGLACESCHFQFKELKTNLDDRIGWARDMGLKQMVLSTFAIKPTALMADWITAAKDLNSIAERVHKAGMQMGFHNHNFEFNQIDGVLVYDKLMETLDPKLVKMQFQVAVISVGFQAATYLKKYAGRFLSLHLQDWSPSEKKEVAVGQGVVDWKQLFHAARAAGVQNYFVELSLDDMKTSYAYLHDLEA
jgi:sugar phosphate isomerase/epimerase